MNDKKLQILNYNKDNYGYVESKFLNIRYYCIENAQHYDTMLYLASLFFGIDDLIKDEYTAEEVANFIRTDMTIVSDTDSETYKEKLLKDFTRFKTTSEGTFKRIKRDFY